mgnify:CR=1 FL=1
MNNENLEKLAKEILKNIMDNNRELSEQEKVGIKVIIDEEHDPEKLLVKCLQYMGNRCCGKYYVE